MFRKAVKRLQISGMKLKTIRKERGISQRELAAKVGCSPGRISHCETNRGGKVEGMIRRIAAALEVPIEAITEEYINWN